MAQVQIQNGMPPPILPAAMSPAFPQALRAEAADSLLSAASEAAQAAMPADELLSAAAASLPAAMPAAMPAAA
ncbi:MAG: hypothetical protein LBD16_08180 [Oscillospiraceae bacterium]|jgi:hypothetical protein|nr:hypothetical protein [Oscillospiraceae bacterium]